MHKKILSGILSAVICMSAMAPVYAAETVTDAPAQTETVVAGATETETAPEEQPAEEAPSAEETEEKTDVSVKADTVIEENRENKAADTKEEVVEEAAAEESSVAPSYASASEVTIAVGKNQSTSYTGEEITPRLDVKYGTKDLREGRDYTVTFENNINAGTAKAHVKGTGDYSFSKDFSFKIEPAELTLEKNIHLLLTGYENRYYRHSFATNSVYVTHLACVCKEGRDYTIEGKENLNVSGGTATITGMGNYKGTVKVSVPTWDPMTVTINCDYVYGTEPKPSVTVKIGSKTLKQGTKSGDGDYYVTVVNKGERTIQVEVHGEYDGAEIFEYKTFGVTNYEIKSSDVTLDKSTYKYTGKSIYPVVTVKANGSVLTKDKDYALEYKNNVQKGTASVIVHGMGNYKGDVTKTFTIGDSDTSAPAQTTTITASLSNASGIVYDGTQKKPAVVVRAGTVTVPSSAYTVTYSNNINAGKATAVVKGSYNGTPFNKTLTFTIKAKELNASNTKVTNGTEIVVACDGKKITKGKDYNISVSSSGRNESVSVIGIGNFIGTYDTTIPINTPEPAASAKAITDVKVVQAILYTNEGAFPQPATYANGLAIKPDVTVKSGSTTLKRDTDFTVSYSNNVNVGTAKVTVTGKGKYKGTITKTFTIEPAAVSCKIVPSATSFAYTGSVRRPKIAVIDTISGNAFNSSDYTVSYSGACINAGTYTVKVTFKGNYKGTKSASFKITPKAVSPKVALSATKYNYDGKTHRPAVTVTNSATGAKIAASDYTVTYSGGGVNAGTYTVKVAMKGNYSGSASASYKVLAKAVNPVVTLSGTKFTYNGKAKTPSVTVKVGGTKMPASAYTVSYAKGRVNVGKYTVKVTMKGNYSGSKTVSFIINPKPTSISMLKGVKGKNEILVTWRKQSPQITGYQIQYSTDPSFKKGTKTVTVGNMSTTSKKLTGIKPRTSYHVRIRTYKQVGNTRYYSVWK